MMPLLFGWEWHLYAETSTTQRCVAAALTGAGFVNQRSGAKHPGHMVITLDTGRSVAGSRPHKGT